MNLFSKVWGLFIKRHNRWTICVLGIAAFFCAIAIHADAQTFDDDSLAGVSPSPPSKKTPSPTAKDTAQADVPAVPPAPTAKTDDARLAVPPAADLNKALTTIRGLFKTEYAQKNIENQKALAKKLKQQADETTDDPTSRFALLCEARDLFARGGDLAEAHRVVGTMAESFRIAPEKMNLDLLDLAAKSGAADPTVVADGYLRSSADLVALDDFDLASKAASKAVTAASKGKNAALLGRAKQQVTSVAETRRDYTQVETAKKTLASQPDDAEANRVVGRYLCLRRDRWTEGLALLAKGSDADLKSLAKADLAAPAKPSDIASLADQWWALSQKKENVASAVPLRRRAAYWYSKAIPDLKGLTKIAAQGRVNEAYAAPEFMNARVSKCVVEVEHTDEWEWFYALNDPKVPDEFAVKVEPRRIHFSGEKKTDQFALMPGHNSSHYGKSVTFEEMKWGNGTFTTGVSPSAKHGRYRIILVDTAGKVTFSDMDLRDGLTYRWTVSEEADATVFRVEGTEQPVSISMPAKQYRAFGFVAYARYIGDKVDFDAVLSVPAK